MTSGSFLKLSGDMKLQLHQRPCEHLVHCNSLLHLLQWVPLSPIMYCSFTKYFTKRQRSSKCRLISLHNIQNHTIVSPPIHYKNFNYLESVTWYKLNQASQILFFKKALISSSVKILSVVFQEVTGSPHSFLRKSQGF